MYKLSREEYRNIKGMSKENLERWLSQRNNILYHTLRKEFEKNFQDELQCSIDCFITAISYSLHFSEETNFGPEQLSSFMDDMLVTVDYFRTGEYKPEEYEEELFKAGIRIHSYDYDRIYKSRIKELEEKFDKNEFKERNEKAINQIENFMANNPNPSCNLGDLQMLEDILKGDL